MARLDAPDRDAIVASLSRHFALASSTAVAAYLFGSVARETATRESDVDVAVLFGGAARPDPLAALVLEGDLERLLRRPVQVVALDTAPPDLVHRVLRDGVIVHESDRGARIRFEVAARNRFFDLQPILARYRRREAARP